MGWAIGLMIPCGMLVVLAIILHLPRPKWFKHVRRMERYREQQRRL